MMCPCCDKPLTLVRDIEPCFRLPDRIAKMTAKDRSLRCLLKSDICTIDWKSDEAFGYARCVVAFKVDGRERPFHWGVWTQLRREDILEYLEMSEKEQSAGECLIADRIWEGTMANDMGLDCETMGQPVNVIWWPGNQRPRVTFGKTDHPLAQQMTRGVSEQETFEWTRPFHALLPS